MHTKIVEMTGGLNLADIIVLVVYLAITVSLGCYFVRKNKTPDQFMRAGGNLSGWVIGLSIFGTYVSSISFLGNPGYAFSCNWTGWVFNLAVPIATIIATRYFVPFYRRENVISCYEPLEKRFGLWARLYTSICFILTQLARMGVILYLLALPINMLTGWNIYAIIIITGLLVMVYTILGGIEGVIYTDALQAIVLIMGAVLCFCIIIYKMPGGFFHIISFAAERNKFSVGSFGPSLIQPTFWVMLAMGFTINLQNLGINQNYVQRYITAKSEREAKKSAWLSAALYIPVSALFFFIGTSLFVYYKIQPHLLPSFLTKEVAAGRGDQIFPFFIVKNLPYGLAGLVVAAIFAAAMSTLSSSLNASATLICEDYYKRFFKKTSDKGAMRVLHVSSLVFGLLAIAASLAMIHVKSALDLNWVLAGVFGGGILGLFLLSVISYKIKNSAAVTAVLIGILSIMYLTFSHMKHIWPASWAVNSLNEFLTPVIGTIIVVLVGFLITLFIGVFSRSGILPGKNNL